MPRRTISPSASRRAGTASCALPQSARARQSRISTFWPGATVAAETAGRNPHHRAQRPFRHLNRHQPPQTGTRDHRVAGRQLFNGQFATRRQHRCAFQHTCIRCPCRKSGARGGAPHQKILGHFPASVVCSFSATIGEETLNAQPSFAPCTAFAGGSFSSRIPPWALIEGRGFAWPCPPAPCGGPVGAMRSFAGVAELADAPDLGSGAAGRGGSSPFTRTRLG